jgi:Zn-finger nucleic acid-binding protein
MTCPDAGAALTMSKCRGAWLDRGELDKILDRMAAETPAAPPPPAPQQDYRQQRYQDSPGYSSSGYGGGKYQGGRRPKKKEHWLSELFD